MTKPAPLDESVLMGTADPFHGPGRWPLGALMAGFLLGAGLVGATWALIAMSTPAPSSDLRASEGMLRVKYLVEDSPTSASGSTLEDVSAIRFQPSYVVVTQRDGSGRVFFAERTRELSWTSGP